MLIHGQVKPELGHQTALSAHRLAGALCQANCYKGFQDGWSVDGSYGSI